MLGSGRPEGGTRPRQLEEEKVEAKVALPGADGRCYEFLARSISARLAASFHVRRVPPQSPSNMAKTHDGTP